MNDRGRIALIFATVAIAAAGGGYYFFKIYRPKQVADDARAEVTAWETRFAAARACLLGPQPGSSKTSEALAVRELAPDPWDRGKCTPLISKLNRGDEPDTGLADVETAWVEIDHAASAAASAFGTHVAALSLDRDPLPDALDRLDAARAKLRAAAGMPAAEPSGKPLIAATIVPIADRTDQVTSLDLEALPSAHGVVIYGKTASRLMQIDLVTGGAVQVARVAADAVRGVPDNTWGTSPGEGGFRVGAFDREGAMPSPQPLTPAGTTAVAAVLGTNANGIVIHGNATQAVVTHVHGDAITSDPVIDILTAGAVADVDGRALMTYTDKKHVHDARIVGPDHDEPAVALDRATTSACLAGDRGWLALDPPGDGVAAIGGGKPVFRQMPDGPKPNAPTGVLQGCTREGALLRGNGRPFDGAAASARTFAICTTECRDVMLPTGAPDLAAATIVGGKLVAIATRGAVVGVWREGAPPVFYSLPEAMRFEVADKTMNSWPAMALTDGKVIDAIAHGAKGFAIVRLPAI